MDPQNPAFQIRVRPQKHDPDVFYVNEYMKHVEGEMFSSRVVSGHPSGGSSFQFKDTGLDKTVGAKPHLYP